MSEYAEPLEAPPPPRPWVAPLALVASLLAVGAAAWLCYSMVAAGLNWHRLPWLQEPGSGASVAIVVWLTASVCAIGFGAVSLLLPRRQSWAAVPVVLGAVCLLGVPAVGVADLLHIVGPHHPSDAKLIDDFHRREPQFQQAIAAFRSGHQRRELRGLGIERAIQWDHEADLILLPVSSWGLVPSGSAKGYAYSSTSLRPATEAETDDYTGDMPNEIVYRHIKGPWYVYYESW